MLSGSRGRFSRDSWRQDLRAGAVLGVESVPDGLAAGALAGVNPIHGLYSYLVGTVVGSVGTSSAFMTVTTTGAMAVVLSDVPQVRDPETSAAALGMLALLAGTVMVVLGLLRLGSLVRFVPHSVLTGFVAAVAVNIVLGQLGNLTGYAGQGANRALRSLDVLLHPGRWDGPTLAVGIATVLVILALERTPLGPLALVVAVGITSAAVALLGATGVAIVQDLTDVPRGLPGLALPDLSLAPALVLPALSIAFVGLVQGAAISGSVPNPDGRYPDASGDFRGQGLANLATGVLQGMPVGGSMSGTALVRAAGARSASATLVAGLVMALLILTLSEAIEQVAMASLAGLLVLVGYRALRPHQLAQVLRTGTVPAVVSSVTFVLTLLIPLQYAVLVGVGMAVVLHVARQSNRVSVRRWVFDEGSPMPREVDPPTTLLPHEVVVLVPYGSLFFAAAPAFRAQLPTPRGRCDRAVVLVRLRGEDELGATFIRTVVDYARDLERAGARLMLAGVGERVMSQLEATGAAETVGREWIHPAGDRVGDALTAARLQALAWSQEDASG